MMPKRVAILISGSGSNMVKLVEAMTGDFPARPVLVASNHPDAPGLGKAAALGVPTTAVDHRPFGRDRVAFDAALKDAIDAHAPDILCLAGFMRVLTPDFVDAYGDTILNIHPSLLPNYKGLDTHSRVLAAGDREHGCTVHRVTEALEEGDILGQARVAVEPNDTPFSLAARVLKQEHVLYPAVLRRFAMDDHRPVYLP